MVYLDTNIILSYGIERDPNHEKARALIERNKHLGKFCTSPFTLVELYSIAYRIGCFILPPGIKRSALAPYLLRKLDIEVIPDERKLGKLKGLYLFHIFFEATQISPKVKLKSGDMLHIAYAKILAEKGLVGYFLTMDKEILERKEEIRESISVEVIGE
ncbi:PIN domain-containing protein [bacterium]|nr:PIN domain-containing protein [bacterium]